MKSLFHYILKTLIVSAIILSSCCACSTGIESTKKIRMNKEDLRMMTKSPEQKFAESIQGIPLSQWSKGKKFAAMSDRTLYIFEPSGYDAAYQESILGHELSFIGLDSHINPDLQEECVILFGDGEKTYRFKTGKPTETALKEIESSKLPLIADLDLISQWKDKLTGLSLWTKSNLWYDASGDRMAGLKFAEVKILDAIPASGDFPIKIKISGPNSEVGYLQMNYTSDTHDSRNFAAIFFLSDPKNRYPNISEENWRLIQRGKVGEGMTKEECKLSIGNPDEVQSGHNRAQTLDIWQYSDGTYLMFADGLLTNFRQ